MTCDLVNRTKRSRHVAWSVKRGREWLLNPYANMSAEQVARTAKVRPGILSSHSRLTRRGLQEAFDASQLLDSSERHKALVALKEALTTSKDRILAANALDIQVAHRPFSPDRFPTDSLNRRQRKSKLRRAACRRPC